MGRRGGPGLAGADPRGSPLTTERRRRLRHVLYAALTAAAFFVGINLVIEWLEGRGVVQTTGDVAGFVEERLFEKQGDRWRTSAYGRQTMVEGSFAARKGDRYRAFVLGGSFAMGTPWVHQASGGGGGIADWMRDDLGRRLGPDRVEVVNAAAGAAHSWQVLQVARELVGYDADLWFVATCNNEGVASPSAVRSYLQRQGGYRLLRQLLAPPTEERSWYTHQDPDSEAVRQSFRENLDAILDLAADRGVPVLLATLPVHLGYRGFEPGHTFDEPDLAVGVRPEDPAAGMEEPLRPPPDPGLSQIPCKAGILAFEAGDFSGAAPLLAACMQRASDPVREAPWVAGYLAIADLEVHGTGPAARARLEARFGPCLAGGIEAFYRGQHAEAEERLSACDDVAEALRWIGLLRHRTGDAAEAARLLEQSVELRPSNRCRPSFNGLIREAAAGRPGVALVDLERAAKEVSGGVPGSDLFLDYCHMTGPGYGAMGREVMAVAGAVDPRIGPPVEPPEDPDAFCRRHGVPLGPILEQVREALRRSGDPVDP